MPASETRRLSRLKTGAIVAAITLGFLLVLEVAARVFYSGSPAILIRDPFSGAVNLEWSGFFRKHPRLFWELRPDLDEPLSPIGDRTNSRGFRNHQDPSSKGSALRVLCMGDSCTYGMGVSIDDTWPSRLARTYGHDAINASSPGYTTYQGLLYHDDRCRDLDADVIVIEYGPNDVGTWASPQDGELLCLTDRERARHVSYTSGRSGSRLIDWLRSLTLPSPEDVQGLSPTVKIARVPLDEFRENLVALASKAPVAVFLVWPLRSQLDPLSPERNLSMDRFAAYQKAIREMAGSGHAVVDVVELFRNSGLPPGDLFVDTVHATPRGCQIIADAVQKRIAEARPRRQRR